MNLKCVAEGATCICIEILETCLNLGAETYHKFKWPVAGANFYYFLDDFYSSWKFNRGQKLIVDTYFVEKI